jgi:quercetin dioxygenase-like cupin family protein
MNLPYILADCDSAEGVVTSEGYIKPLIATSQVSLTAMEVYPGEEVIPHRHSGLPYFEVILYILEGRLEVIARQERIAVEPGNAIMVNPDEMGWINRTDKTVRALMIHAPPPAWKSAEGMLDRIKGRSGSES